MAVLQNGKMNGFIPNGSDADWSDEDAVKSGSATGYSETEQDDVITKKKQAIITAKSLNGRKYDPINMILDKIDAELSSLSKSQSSSATGSTVVRKPGGKHRKTSGDDHVESPRSGGSHRSEGTDTGLGTSSLQSEGDHHKINGSSELYSDTGALLTDHDEEGQKKGTPSDLDSVSAQQVDEKFKEIMRKKKGGYLENLKSGPGVSDTETVRTEDYEKKFRDALVTLSDSDTLENDKSEADDESETVTISDTESNQLGDLSWDYFDTVSAHSPATVPKSSAVQKNPATGPQSPRTLKNNVQKSAGCKKGMKNEHSKIQRRSQESSPVLTNRTTDEGVKSPRTPRRDQNSTPPIYPRPSGNSPTSPRRSTEKLNLLKGKKKQGYVSDADSIRTEDFEVRFHELIIKQPPESEGDTTDNDPLHDRVRDILKATAPYKRKTGSPATNNSRSRSSRDESSDVCSDKDAQKRRKRNSVQNLEHTNSIFNWNDPFWAVTTHTEEQVRRDSAADCLSSSSDSLLSPPSSASSKDYSVGKRFTFQKSNSCGTLNASGYPRLSVNSGELSSSHSSIYFDEKNSSLLGQDLSSLSKPDNFLLDEVVSVVADGQTRSKQDKSSNCYGKSSVGKSYKFPSASSINRAKSLIIPDDEEEYPFARYTFNKKPDIYARSTSVAGSDLSSVSSSDISRTNSSSSCGDLTKYSRTSSYSKPNFHKSVSESSLSSYSHTSSSLSSDLDLPVTYNLSSFDSGQVFLEGNPLADSDCGTKQSQHVSNMFPTPFRDAPTDQFLYDLGFAGVESFLPERFARDWYDKICQSKQEMLHQQGIPSPYQFYNVMSNSIYSQHRGSSSSAQHGGPTSPNSIGDGKRHSSDKLPECDANMSAGTGESGQEKQQSQIQEQSTIEKLRQILQNEMVSANKKSSLEDAVKEKHRQFSLSRQHSLPVYLDTLNEEKESLDTSFSSDIGDDANMVKESKGLLITRTSAKRGQNQKTAIKHNDSKIQNVIPQIFIGTDPSSRGTLFSTDSLEVEQILMDSSGGNDKVSKKSDLSLKIVEEGATKSQTLNSAFLHVDTDDCFLIPSPTSSRSTASPYLYSPITVIEANLDNQNDSLDIEDSQCPQITENVEDKGGSKSKKNSRILIKKLENPDDFFHSGRKSPVRFYLDSDDGMSSGGNRRNSSIDNMSTAHQKDKIITASKLRRSSLPQQGKHGSPCEIFDNIMGSSDFDHSKQTTDYDFNVCDRKEQDRPSQKVCPDLTLRKVFQEIPKYSIDSNEISVQVDDGKLSPILTFTDADLLEEMLKKIEAEKTVFCVSQDKETQYDSELFGLNNKENNLNGFYRNKENGLNTELLGINQTTIGHSSMNMGNKPQISKQDSESPTAYKEETTMQGTQTEPENGCCCCCHSDRSGSPWRNFTQKERQAFILDSENKEGHERFRYAVNEDDSETLSNPYFPVRRNSRTSKDGALFDQDTKKTSGKTTMNEHIPEFSFARDNFIMASVYQESFDNGHMTVSRTSSVDMNGSDSGYPDVFKENQQGYYDELNSYRADGHHGNRRSGSHQQGINGDNFESGHLNDNHVSGCRDVRSPLGDDQLSVTRSIHWVNPHTDQFQQRYVSSIYKFIPLCITVDGKKRSNITSKN